MVRRLMATALVLASFVLATTAHAQPKTAPSAAEPVTAEEDALLGQAKRLHAEGVAFHKAGQLEDAFAAFSAAWAIKKHYRVAGPLGEIELSLGKNRRAAEHLRYYMLHVSADEDPSEKIKAEKLLAKATALVVTLSIEVKPSDAVVKINGTVVDVSEAAFYEPGAFNIGVSHKDYIGVVERHTVGAGNMKRLAITLKPEGKPPLPDEGPDALLVAGIAIGVGALAGFGVGIGGSVAASRYADDAAALRADKLTFACTPTPALNGAECGPLMEAVADENAAIDLSIGGYVSGAALAAVSVGLLVWWAQDDESTTTVTIVPLVGRDSAGVMLGGAW